VRLLSPSPLVGFSTPKVYSGIGADIVMESITLIDWFLSNLGLFALSRAIAATVPKSTLLCHDSSPV
ncbi:MAG: hypothetical protein WBE44_15460, partial [Terriglobales bacterium]